MTTQRRFGGVCCCMIAGLVAVAALSKAVAFALPILPNTRVETHAMPDDKDSNEGWKILFDGKSSDAWRGYKKDKLPDGWQVVDRALACVHGGGDIITKEQFDSFEFVFDWKISEGGNSGVMFRVSEAYGASYESGPEYQVLDNAKHPDGRSKITSASSNYALHAPTQDMTKPVGEWNKAKILVDGNHVEHWLNGEKVVEYELGGAEWTALVKKSKFNEMPHYGREPKGHIALQDHGDRVEYRNIKIRPIKSKTKSE